MKNPFDLPWETKPEFVNELGVKWWKDDHMTEYARNPDRYGTVLDAVCFYAEHVDKTRTRLLVSRLNGQIIEEDSSIEGMACKIEIRKMLIRDHELNTSKEN